MIAPLETYRGALVVAPHRTPLIPPLPPNDSVVAYESLLACAHTEHGVSPGAPRRSSTSREPSLWNFCPIEPPGGHVGHRECMCSLSQGAVGDVYQDVKSE